MDEKYENRSEVIKGEHVDENQGKAVVTGFHSETTESEVLQLLKESINQVGMDIGNARIECTVKPITHAFFHFKNDGERNKFIRFSEYVEKRIDRKKSKDNEINGRRRKVPQQKNGVRQVLHPHETQRPTRINKHKLDNEIRIDQRSDCREDSTKWKPEIHQIPRC